VISYETCSEARLAHIAYARLVAGAKNQIKALKNDVERMDRIWSG